MKYRVKIYERKFIPQIKLGWFYRWANLSGWSNCHYSYDTKEECIEVIKNHVDLHLLDNKIVYKYEI